MTKPARFTDIPNYLASSSISRLRRLMLENNKASGNFHNYQIIWNDTERKWYAWYIDTSMSDELSLPRVEKQQ